ncbi:MAG TPA: hypothetical protein VG757_17035 [Devosia sp.]|nr:hypothetical protein [Devosia sp.]
MKLTWFGGTALRVYVGGEIVVVDAEFAPAGVDRAELLAGAGFSVKLGGPPAIDPAQWRPAPPPRGIDDPRPIEIASIAPFSLLIAASSEPPLVVLGPGQPPRYGRWADGAVVLVTSSRESVVAEVTVLLDVARPRMVVLAFEGDGLDTAIAEISEHLQGVGLAALEPGLALEV